MVVTILWFLVGITQGQIEYQVHSVNDLREWNALFKKGARSFKVDPHYVDNEALLLSHDTPVNDTQYFTVKDLVTLLSEKAPTGIRVALCFKDGEPCSEQWSNLVDDFYADATNRSAQVQFVLDGDGKPSGCNKNKWQEWISVWIQDDELSPDAALLTGYPRYAILNNPESMIDWTILRKANYFKFSTRPEYLQYPLQLWEPSDALSINKYYQIYLDGPPHLPGGFAIATNTDVKMFETYAANASGEAWHQPLTQLGAHSTKPSLVSIKSNNITLIITYFQETTWQLAILEAPYQFGPIRLNKKMSIPDCIHVQNQTLSLSSYDQIILLASASHYALLHGETLETQTCGSFPLSVLDVSLANASLVWLAFSDGVARFDLSTESQEVHIKTKVSYTQTTIAAINVSHAIFVSTKNNTLWTALFSDQGQVTTMTPLGVGSDPSLAITQGYIFLTSASGFCYNSHDHNTQASPLLCDQVPQATEWTLDYYYGPLHVWLERLLLNSIIEQQSRLWWTACDDTILHGSFSLGKKPAVALYSLPMNSSSSFTSVAMAHAVIHEGFATNATDSGSCGDAVRYDGLVLSAFPLPSL